MMGMEAVDVEEVVEVEERVERVDGGVDGVVMMGLVRSWVDVGDDDVIGMYRLSTMMMMMMIRNRRRLNVG
jgi:hypothetical protein